MSAVRNIVIVDAFSTGENFIEDITMRGYRPVVLWTRRSEEMLAFYDEEGLTGCVLKPYRGASSIDVRVCDTRQELIDAYWEITE